MPHPIDERPDVLEFIQWAVRLPIVDLRKAALALGRLSADRSVVSELIQGNAQLRAIDVSFEGYVINEYAGVAYGVVGDEGTVCDAVIPVARALLVSDAMERQPSDSRRRRAFDRITGVFPGRPRGER
jgi:hypothetical protein